MSNSEKIGFAICLIIIVILLVLLTLFKVTKRNYKQQFNFNVGLIVLDRDSVIDSIYVDKNMKVIDCVTTKK